MPTLRISAAVVAVVAATALAQTPGPRTDCFLGPRPDTLYSSTCDDPDCSSPMSYELDGKQFIVLAVSGNDGAELLAYALP